MTDHETRKPEAKPAPKKSESNADLLEDFGAKKKAPAASAKATPAKAAPTKAAPAKSVEKPQASAASAPAHSAPTEKKEKKESSTPAKSASAKAASTKDKPASVKHESKNEAKKDAPTKEDNTVRATTAPAPKREKPKKDRVEKTDGAKDDAPARSAKPAHRVLPYVFLLLAVFVGVSLILNLLCNRDNALADNPSAHWMGSVGYYICYWLFGLLGPAVYVLPLLLLNLAFFWKQYIDHRITISKIVASLVFLFVLSAVIHIFSLIATVKKDFSASELIYYGARMTGGGLLGGKLGYLFYQFFNVAGSLIIGFFLLALSFFYFLGMTPQKLWNHIRPQREKQTERAKSVSEEDAEAAREKAQMQEKIRRVTGRQMTIDDEQKDDSDGAVTVVKSAKRSEEDKLAPMPLPQLDPTDGTRPFVPVDVGRRINEAKRAEKNGAAAPVQSTQQPVTPTQPKQTQPASPASAAPVSSDTPAAPAANPAKNRDTAVDPIFPPIHDAKQVRRVPKEDRGFDLLSVFTEKQESEPTARPRKHAPIPPEVPLGSAPAQKPTAQPQRPAAGTAPVTKTAPAAAAPQKPTAQTSDAPKKVPSLSGVKPAPVASSQPVFKQADKTKKEYGLSSEEFEQLEAQKAGGTAKKSEKTTAPSSEKAPKKAEKKPAAPTKAATDPKADVPKKYVFPPISYLQPGEPMTEENKAEIQASMEQLAATLASFRVKVDEINYSCGPTVTRYEVVLAPGVRVRNVITLADDIALALRSTGGVRIEAPIPGTNAVGIEVPNKTRSTIYLRDLIESDPFTKSKSKLTACLGADIAGDPLIFDIAKMPHLLIAGTTGSGKSVCINCIIMSLLYKVRPDEVKLVLIDPKKVEFSIYKNIPHLMAPVVTMPRDAAGALQAAVEEMERRFEIFENVGVRDLKGYNEITADDPDMPYIPHIVIIIDELADLMMTAKNEVETAICRIAQKARAAGMHLIIGTQRPSADVVTGLIKANVPSSIAFAVKSQIDSRVILDHGGAEALTGRGDMLFVPIGAMRDTRVQGAFVADKEVEKICEFIRATNGTAHYDERFTAKLKELAAQCGNKGKSNDDVPVSADGEKGDDPKYADAVRVAIEEGRISTSLLQRKLELGYSRAAKLIDRMQSEGIVSPPNGSKPRSILISKDQYLERFFSEDAGDGQS